MSQLLYSSRITKAKFKLSGSETARKDSFIEVTTSNLYRDNQPQPGGPNDVHMGTNDMRYRCQTCFHNKNKCLGHEGNYDLNYPVWNPVIFADIRKWLKVICFKCGQPVLDEASYIKFPRAKRLYEAAKLSRMGQNSKNSVQCCGEIHPIVKKDPKENLMLVAWVKADKSYNLLPHMVLEIFSRISDETVIKLGKSPLSHPRHFVLTSIKVPPVTIRPDVHKIGGGKSTNDDLTTMLQIIIKKNETIPAVITDYNNPSTIKSIVELNNTYNDFVKAGGENSQSSLALRLKGKDGRFRKNQLGKRVCNMARSTITGDPHVRPGWLNLPLAFATTFQYEETVQEYNKKRLLSYVFNGRKNYPGATKIIKKSTGVEYDLENAKDVELENGDIIMRDLIDGDVVGFNRQPSLMSSAISTCKIKVVRNPDIMVISFNVIDTALYGADFDGDAMNIIATTSICGRNEIKELSSVSNWLISQMSSGPMLGQTNDSIVGMAELTRNYTHLDKYHAMLLFRYSTVLPDCSDITAAGISGRECVSKILEETPINFTRGAKWYVENMVPFINYQEDEINVVIKDGKHIQGILDKSSISATNGSIYQIIANEYGAEKSLEVMFNMQQMAINLIVQTGCTIGIKNLLIPQKNKKLIDEISSNTYNKSQLITDQLTNGEILPPIDKTVRQYYEEQQISILRVMDDYAEIIFDSFDVESNDLIKTVMYGAKGKMEHVYTMVTAGGQKLINGERILETFGGRTGINFRVGDQSPEARGYIGNSYIAGMNSAEYVSNAMASRFGLVTRALSTAVTGDQMRKSIKNLESTITNNLRWSMKSFNVIDFGYGEDYLDPRYLERVKFRTIFISDSKMKEIYHNEAFPDEFSALLADRAKYREVFLRFEDMNEKDFISDTRDMSVNVERIIDDIIITHASDMGREQPKPQEIKEMVRMVREFCEVVPYILINEIQERRRTPIPPPIAHACILMLMLIRANLYSNMFTSRKITPKILKIIIDKIRMRYSASLVSAGTCVGIITAQSFSSPLTQYILDAHHRSATGGTSKSGITRVKEIMGAKPADKLSTTSMLIPILPQYSNSMEKVQEIANNIEVMKMERFVTYWQIFYEKFGEPVHSKTIHEVSMIRDFVKMNPLLAPPGDLVRWCIRLVLNKTNMIMKNMSLETIVTKLRDLFQQLYIVYTAENAPEIVLRIYMRSSMFKSVNQNEIKSRLDKILDATIRGTNGIIDARAVKMLRSQVNEDGSISRNPAIYGISTTGSNMRGIFANKFVDKLKVQTDVIQETYDMLGIEAARQKLISAIRGLVATDCNHRHFLVYANEMTYTGRVTSIESNGLKARESANILLRMGFSSPLSALEEAARNTMEDSINGVSGPFIMGTVPILGTVYNKFMIDGEFVRENVKRADDVIDELFD